jgi:hypothetical protein
MPRDHGLLLLDGGDALGDLDLYVWQRCPCFPVGIQSNDARRDSGVKAAEFQTETLPPRDHWLRSKSGRARHTVNHRAKGSGSNLYPSN